MPSGRTHAKATLLLTPLCLAAGGLFGGLTCGLAAAGGCLAGIPLSPDLDQEGLSTCENQMIKKTMGLAFLWPMLWYPYARCIPHRGFASHFPVVGTLIRILYLLIFARRRMVDLAILNTTTSLVDALDPHRADTE
jgi:uncharacterized metal-binding protein